jgi:hypothetical protein
MKLHDILHPASVQECLLLKLLSNASYTFVSSFIFNSSRPMGSLQSTLLYKVTLKYGKTLTVWMWNMMLASSLRVRHTTTSASFLCLDSILARLVACWELLTMNLGMISRSQMDRWVNNSAYTQVWFCINCYCWTYQANNFQNDMGYI